jgi:hypothetical protein
MGMTCTLHRATAADIVRLREDPSELSDFLDSTYNGPRLEVEEVRPPGLLGFLLRLTPIKIEQVKPLSEEEANRLYEPSDRELDLDKSWHGLHYLFTGTAWEGELPGSFLVTGGQDIGDEDSGWGLVRALSPAQVRDIAGFLALLSPQELEQRFDAKRMAGLEIYPDVIWTRAEEADGTNEELTYLIEAFGNVREFVERAAEADDGLLISLS